MSVLTRPAALLATAAVAVGLIAAPSAAHAAGTTTQLTAVQMSAALEEVAAASGTAGANGWQAAISFSGLVLNGVTETVVFDKVRGIYHDTFTMPGHPTAQAFLADGRGTYELLVRSTRERAALKMIGRPTATYVFTADKNLDVADYVADYAPDPASLAGVTYGLAGTRTALDDGSADYTLVDVVEDTTAELTLNVSAAGVLTGLHASTTDGAAAPAETTLAYTYGPQTVTLPGAAATIAEKTLAGGMAYLDMATTVRRAVTAGAADARKAAKGGKVSVTTLRKVVGRDVAAVNRAVTVSMVKVKNVPGGVRVYATNPWTKQTVAYTVKASGKKVVVKKA